jgi:hypothetical protein
MLIVEEGGRYSYHCAVSCFICALRHCYRWEPKQYKHSNSKAILMLAL